MPRQRAEWMRPIDDRILEALEEEGNLSPKAIEVYVELTSSNHASHRLSALNDGGLVERLAPGLYRLTDAGQAYLDRELDASELPGPDADE